MAPEESACHFNKPPVTLNTLCQHCINIQEELFTKIWKRECKHLKIFDRQVEINPDLGGN